MLLFVDAHYGYYADQTVLDQLHRECVFAASPGLNSTGPSGSPSFSMHLDLSEPCLYASRYECDLTGVVAMAPFLRNPDCRPRNCSGWRAGSVDVYHDHVRRNSGDVEMAPDTDAQRPSTPDIFLSRTGKRISLRTLIAC